MDTTCRQLSTTGRWCPLPTVDRKIEQKLLITEKILPELDSSAVNIVEIKMKCFPEIEFF